MSGPTSDPNWKSSTPKINIDASALPSQNSPPQPHQNGQTDPNPPSSSAQSNPQPTHIRISKHLKKPHLTSNHRSLSDVLRAVRGREEQENLLGDDEVADADGCLREEGVGMGIGPREVFFRDPHGGLDVYYNIHR